MNDEVSKTCLIRFRKKRLKSKDEHLKVLVVFCLYLFFFLLSFRMNPKIRFCCQLSCIQVGNQSGLVFLVVWHHLFIISLIYAFHVLQG